MATYLYGPLGPISRTAELGDGDVSNNQESYYLRDGMGGNVGMSYWDSASASQKATFTTYDSFGNAITPETSRPVSPGSFAWRGGEVIESMMLSLAILTIARFSGARRRSKV